VEKIKIAVLGCCGVLGQRFVQMLNEHPTFEVSALVDVFVGKKYREATVKWGTGSGGFDDRIPEYAAEKEICSVDNISKDVALVFSALPSGIAGPIESDLAKKGHIVVSKASDHRMEQDVPLIIPEVNPDHLHLIEKQRKNRSWKGAVICAPNCSTTIFALPLKPVLDKYGVRNAALVTMQAVSGAGYPGLPSLDIMDNVIPYIGGEEEKTIVESKKILGDIGKPANYGLASYCCRVNAIDGHLECVFVQTEKKANADDVRHLMKNFHGTGLHSGPKQPIIVRDEIDRPQTRLDRYAGEGRSPYVRGMSVTVGRIRNDDVFGLSFITLGHNTIRGGAGEVILLGELLKKNEYI
jgi:aspartate-semialdehyde dehydrogenase